MSIVVQCSCGHLIRRSQEEFSECYCGAVVTKAQRLTVDAQDIAAILDKLETVSFILLDFAKQKDSLIVHNLALYLRDEEKRLTSMLENLGV